MRRPVFQITFVLAIALIIAVPATEAQELGWSLRLNGTWTDPNERSVYDKLPDVWVEASTSETFGLALSAEYRFSDRFGLEVGAQRGYEVAVDYDVREKLTGGILGDPLDPHPNDDMRFTVVDLALNIYLASGPIDLYVGPVIGLIDYQETVVREADGEPKIPLENEGGVAYGGVIGLDIPFNNSPWFFTSSMKYLKSSYDTTATVLGTNQRIKMEVDFDPWIWRMGLGYKF